MSTRSRALAVIVAACVLLLGGGAAATSSARVVRIVIDGGITEATRSYVEDALRSAEASGARALVIELDTPGGLLEATRGIVRDILDAKVPVITYVTPRGARAGSAGLFITLASHVAAMAPSTNIGAAHPVSLFGGEGDETMSEKVTNDTAAWARSLAETRGRDADAAQRAVKESESFTVREAVERHLVDLEAGELDSLLGAIDGRTVSISGKPRVLLLRGARVESFDRTSRQALYDWLANPTLLYVILLLGILGIYIELQSPGLIVPGVIGAACLGVVFGLQILPVNAFGALLIGLAAVLFFAEIYVTSFGLLSVGALACLVLGSYLLFDVPGSTFRLAPSVIWTVAVTFTALLLFVGSLLVRAKRQGPTSGVGAFVGREAVTSEPIGPEQPGRVFFDGAYWNAASGVEIAEGATVRVDAVDGLTLHVSPLETERNRSP